jgi:ribonucleoside-diphosphate reductase alpha chain
MVELVTDRRIDLDGNLGLSENALRVLRARYLKKDDRGSVVETPHQLFSRVAGTIAEA